MKGKRPPAFCNEVQWRFFSFIGFIIMLPYATGLGFLYFLVTLSTFVPEASLELTTVERAWIFLACLTVVCITLGFLISIFFPPAGHAGHQWVKRAAFLLLMGTPGLALASQQTQDTFLIGSYWFLIIFNLSYGISSARHIRKASTL